ncbi:MAG: MurR/RpiR family transcriptional regulator [Oscillospiraceae bacterium]|nr:MurR/RpiR family transcriptional regulator [Oscillospiraceae bacterium]MBR6953492.1 MurR/RpiR family transcriptional regulator [Clostridia bacterium]
MQDLISQLNRSGKRLSKGHRKIAQYIEEHYEKAAHMTAGKLAEAVGISDSTVVRFAAALGYEGYPQLLRALQELVSHRLTAGQRMELAEDMTPAQTLSTVLRSDVHNLRATAEGLDPALFDRVVNRILGARAIYVIGLRSAAPLAQFMGFYLNYIFDDVHLVSSGVADVFEEVARMRPGDVMIGISFPRYSSRTLEAMRFAKRCGAHVIAITDGPMSPLCAVAEDSLTARTEMASFVDSLTAPMAVINAVLVALGVQRREALAEHFRQLEAIWDTYAVYIEGEEGEADGDA